MAGEIIGKVQSIQGVVQVRGADGKVRVLQLGDELREGDTVLTTGGGKLVILLADGGLVNIDAGQTVAMTAELSSTRFPGADEAQVAAVDPLARAILGEGDLNKLLEDTAAGPAGGAGAGNEGHSFVQLLRVSEVASSALGLTTTGRGAAGTDFERITPLAEEPAENSAPVGTQIEAQTNVDGDVVGGVDVSRTFKAANAPEGSETGFDISGAFSDADGDTLTYIATGLPPGLSLDPVTGIISGTITSSASDATNDDNNQQIYVVTVTASDSQGALSNPLVFNWVINNAIPEFLSGTDTAATAPNADVYSFSANENDAAGTLVGMVASADADRDTATYSITGGNDAGLFAINAATGAITLTQAVDDADLGNSQLTVQVSDNEGGIDTATVNITLNNVNDPLIDGNEGDDVNDAVTTPEDMPIAGNVLENTTDVDGPNAPTVTTFVVAGDPTVYNAGQTATVPNVGTLTLDSNGDFVFTPVLNYNGPVPVVTYTVTDGVATDTSTLTINVTPINDPPVDGNEGDDVNDAVTTPEDMPISGNVLENATDVDGPSAPSVTVFVVAGDPTVYNAGQTATVPNVGTLTLDSNGDFVFTPVLNYNGPVPVVTYTVTDGVATDTSTLTINVTPVNDPPVDGNEGGDGNEAITTPEDTTLTGTVLANTTDVDGPNAPSVTTFQVANNETVYNAGDTASIPGVGTLVINSDGSYSFTPAQDYNGPVPVVTYTITDGLATDTSTLTISVTPVNDPPVDGNEGDDGNEAITTPEDTTLTGTVLANTTDVDGPNAPSVTQFQVAGNPTVYGAGDTATIPGVGMLVINSDGGYSFTPAQNYNGPVPVVTYTVTDGVATDTSTLTISVTPVNDPPVGAPLNDLSSFDADAISLGISGAFSDVDPGTVLTYSATGLPPGLSINDATGVISGTIDHSASDQTNDNNNQQIYAVTVTASDGQLTSNAVSFNWTVNNTIPEFVSGGDTVPTTPNDDAYAFGVGEGTLSGTAVGTVVSADADGDTPTYNITGGNDAGLFALNASTGVITLTRTVDDSDLADYALTVQVSDGEGGFDTATVNIAVNNINDPPVANPDTNPGDPVVESGVNPGNTPFAGDSTAAGNVLGNDTDVDVGDVLTVASVNGEANNVGTVVTGVYGSVTIGSDGAYTYTLNNADLDTNKLPQGASVTDVFTYVARDVAGATSGSTLTITITGTNDQPVAVGDTNAGDAVEEDTDSTAVGNVLANDTDVDTDAALSVAAVNSVSGNVGNVVTGTYGSVTIGSDGAYTYTLNNADPDTNALPQGATFTDTFSYTVTDQFGATSTASLVITITGTNDGPVITTQAGQAAGTVRESGNFDPGAIDAGTPTVMGTLTSSDADTGATATWSGNADSPYGSFAITSGGVWTYTLDNAAADSLAEGSSATETFTATVTDDKGATATQVVSITIQGTNDSPMISFTAGDDAGSVKEDYTSSVSGQLNASDVDTGATEAWSIQGTNSSTYGTISVDGTGKWTYALNNSSAAVQGLAAGQVITETYVVRVTDDKDAWDDQTVTVTINGTNDGPTIVTDSGNLGGANDVVYEAGLANGSGMGPTTITVGGTFTVSDADGLDDIQSVTIGGTTIAIGNLGNNNIIAGSNGTLTITGYVAGVATYTYTLTSPATDVANATETDSFSLTVSDGTSTSATANIVIDIVDDLPTLCVDNLAIANVAGTFSGNLDFVSGADTQPFNGSFDAASLSWTNMDPDAFSFAYNAATQLWEAKIDESGDTFFTVKLNSDGTYDFNLVTPEPITTDDVPSLLTTITGGNGQPSFTIPASNFGGQFALVLTGHSNAHPLPVGDTINLSSASVGVGDDVMHGNKGDVLRFDVQPVNGSDATPTSLTVHVDGTAGWKATDSVDLIIKYVGEPATTVTQMWGNDRTATFALDPNKTVDYVEITPSDTDAAFKIDSVAMSYTVQTFPGDYQLDFSLTGSDADGDTASTTFAVAVNTTDTSAYQIVGTSGSDSVYGTAGNDTLVGGDGNDTFVWKLADKGSAGAPAVDTITDFNVAPVASGGDALDLRDLLQGEAHTAASLDGFLNFSVTSNGGTPTTTISISSTSGGPVEQVINLTGVDLSAGTNGTDAAIIQNLLNANKLITD